MNNSSHNEKIMDVWICIFLGFTGRENICVGREVNLPEGDTCYVLIFLIL